MRVKDLIEELKKLPQEASVCISTLASENCLYIKDIKYSDNWVEIKTDDMLFKLDENGLALIEQMQDEEAEFNAMNSMSDIEMGK